MKIVWVIFMTLIFGGLSAVMRKKYVADGELKQLYYPPVFSDILYGCFAIAFIFSFIMIFLYQDNGIAVLFGGMGIVCGLGAWAIRAYRIIVGEDEITIVYPLKKGLHIPFSEINYLEKNFDGGISIHIDEKKKITIGVMLVGVDELTDFLVDKGVCQRIEQSE